MKSAIISICLVCFLMCSCATLQKIPLNTPESNEIPLYTTIPSRAFNEIEHIEVSGSVFHTHKSLVRKLRKNVQPGEFDALIELKFGYVFWWPQITAIGIKFKN